MARELAERGGDRVILVTSKAHSRRAKAIWRAVAGTEERAIVRYARSDPFDGRRWWERSEQRGVAWHELLGLVNVCAGFPARPDWAGAPSPEGQIIGRSVAEPVTGYRRGKWPTTATVPDLDQADHSGGDGDG